MTYPAPLSPYQLYLYWLLIGAFPQVGVTDTVWLEDPEDASKAVVDENLQFIGDGIGGPPGFGFDIGVEDFELSIE